MTHKTIFQKNLEKVDVIPSFSLVELMDSGIHIGHNSKRRHPAIAKYLLGSRNNVDIFDLTKTTFYLNRALNFITQLTALNRKILIVNENTDFKRLIQIIGQKTNNPYVSKKWVGGYLTNFKKQYVKISETAKTKESLDIFFPSAIFVLSVKKSQLAVKEAHLLKIPVIGVVDSDTDPSGITYPIFGNDDSVEAIFLYTTLFLNASIKATIIEENITESK